MQGLLVQGYGPRVHAQERKELAGRVRARQTGTLAPSPLKRWMSPSLIERNFQCAFLRACPAAHANICDQ